MQNSRNTLQFKIERTIPAPPSEVFDAWLNPAIPGNPWNAAEKFVLNAKVDGLFYWALKGASHYGRFTDIERPGRIQHTWVSPNTLGEESTVTITFTPQGEETLMTLVHSDLPDHERAKGHVNGWNYFMDVFREQFGNGSRKDYRWDEAHASAEK
ncbi:MAG TPA: SRPBCC domain-containing protein [Terriglobales bacterium]|nr:SRPBCC domain-containing protein [Terriglobales bacterium]